MLVEDLENLVTQAYSRMTPDQVQGIKNAISEVKQTHLKENAVKVGYCIEDIELPNIYGDNISLKSLIKSDYLLVNFYRGGWCPFCVLELRAYEMLKDEFAKAGIDIVAISPELSKYSLDTKEKNSLSFEVLSDINSQAMKKFGLAFPLNERVKELYHSFGIDVPKQNGNDSYEMPVPATYVLDKDLKIVFAHIEEDHTTRAEPAEVLDYVKSL